MPRMGPVIAGRQYQQVHRTIQEAKTSGLPQGVRLSVNIDRGLTVEAGQITPELKAQIAAVAARVGLPEARIRYLARDTVDVSASNSAATTLSAAGALRQSQTLDKDVGAYHKEISRLIGSRDLESADKYKSWLKDPSDTFNISPIVKDGKIAGGAHTQFAASAPGTERPNRYGSLECAWGRTEAETKLAVAAGLEELEKLARNSQNGMRGVVADVPTNSLIANQMEFALRKAGFVPFYSGPQPELEAGKGSSDVRMFVKAPPNERFTREDAKAYVDAYWSSFASIDGNRSKLENDPAYLAMKKQLEKLPSEEQSQTRPAPQLWG